MKTALPRKARPSYRFGPITVDPARRQLLRDGTSVALFPKSFDVLVVLLENAGALLTKDHLLREAWPDTDVGENNLARAISDIRRALGEGPKEQAYIVTVPRVGYRFVADIEGEQQGDTAAGLTTAIPSVIRSIAVLPFACTHPAEDPDHLAFGLADALTTRLSRIRQLVVRPSTSVAKHVGSDESLRLIGQQLNVDALISGSIRRGDDRIRVSVQLVSVASDATLWAELFDATATDMFCIEDSIASRVVASLAVELTGRELSCVARHDTIDQRAHNLYLKGRYFWAKRTSAAIHSAIECFKEALEFDRSYALAHTGLADAQIALGLPTAVEGAVPPHETMPKARKAAQAAIAADNTLAEPHSSLALISFFYDWDRDTAQREFETAIELNPNYSTAIHWYAMMLSMLARHDEAIAAIVRARALDPLSLIVNGNVGFLLYRARRHEEAIGELQDAVALEPTFSVNRYRLGLAYEAQGQLDAAANEYEAMRPESADPLRMSALAHLYAVTGRKSEAEALLNQLLERVETHYVSATLIAEVYVALGRFEQAFDWLNRAYAERSSMLPSLATSPKWDSLRQDSRFEVLMNRVGLWRAGTLHQP
jgi:DNA-binding winged helix-turn-helix (wHTH) protein/tetratricopeptide (TPR) repeat protein